MALVVEDGTAKSNSNAYGNTTSADAYYSDQGYSDTSTDGALIRGSRALDERYRLRLQGLKSTSGQAMAWPRDGVSDEDGNPIGASEIPARWQYAAFEMARAVAVDQSVSEDASIKAVGAGSARVEFASPKYLRTIVAYVDELVAPFLEAGGSRFVRA